jgi:hypothetical protein
MVVHSLTPEFNTASISRGGIFHVDLHEGGIISHKWNLEVTSGKATFLGETNPGVAGISEKWFKAEFEAGDIEIVATSLVGGSPSDKKHTFKIQVI